LRRFALEPERQRRATLAYDQQTLLAKLLHLEEEIILLQTETSRRWQGPDRRAVRAMCTCTLTFISRIPTLLSLETTNMLLVHVECLARQSSA
jgi:hypothetical protein